MSNISNRSDCHCPSRIEQRRRIAALCHPDDPLREQLAARSLETIHFGREYCGRALSRREGGEWGDGNECTGDEALCRRERSETADGRCGPGRGKGSGSRREDNLQRRDRHNRDGIYDFIALERQALADVRLVLFAGRREDILRSRVRAKRRLVNVRFTPKAPEVVHCGELTGCANSGLMHCSKNHSSTCVCNANITMVEASRSPP